MLRALEEFDVPEGATVLEPFCGAGEGLLTAQLANRNAVGFEAYPFLRFAAHVKTRRYSDLPGLRSEMEALLEHAAAALEKLDNDGDLQWLLASRVPAMPRLQSWISNRVVWKVLALHDCILEHVSEEQRGLPLLALASVLRGASHMRISPHAYGSRESKPFTPVLYHFDAKLRKMLDSIESLQADGPLGNVAVVEGDAREAIASHLPAPAQLAVASPPALNDPDPTLQTRLELFFLGYVQDMAGLERLRARISFYEETTPIMRASQLPAVREIAEAIEGKPGSGGQAARNYFENLLLLLESLEAALAPGAHLVLRLDECVLSGEHVGTPNLAAEIGRMAGFAEADVRVLNTRRHPASLGGLKECAVVLRKV
jgi:hypothetical protein